MAYRIAVASTDGKVVNEHFGRAEVFYILEAEADGSFSCTEKRSVEKICESGNHREDKLFQLVERIKDCGYILVSRIGKRAELVLEREGIQVFELPGVISESVEEMIKYLEVQKLMDSFVTGKEND